MQVTTPLIDGDLASAQTWTTMDRRGNWSVNDYTLDQASVNETHTPNGLNEHETMDPDGPGGPLDAVSLVYDDTLDMRRRRHRRGAPRQHPQPGTACQGRAGNRTLAPLAPRRVTSIDHLAGTTGEVNERSRVWRPTS
ncbi:MAG: hypothetical protein HRF50_17350 [Phycisphaerae bacterium]|jgi:hypothetical protein